MLRVSLKVRHGSWPSAAAAGRWRVCGLSQDELRAEAHPSPSDRICHNLVTSIRPGSKFSVYGMSRSATTVTVSLKLAAASGATRVATKSSRRLYSKGRSLWRPQESI